MIKANVTRTPRRTHGPMTIGASTFSFNSEPAIGPVRTKARNVALVAGIRRYRVITLPSFLAGWILAFTYFAAFGQDAETKEALRLINETAGQICQTSPLEQNSTGTELSGEAKAKVGGIVGKLVDLGISGAAEYQSGHSAGVLQKDLITAIEIGNKCKLQVFLTLERDLLGAKRSTPGVQTEPFGGDPDKPGAMKKNAKDMRLEQAIMGTWSYTIKSPPSWGVADFKLRTTYLPGGKAIQRGSPIFQGQMITAKISGKWSISDGILYCNVESSNVPFVNEGDTWEGKIISITNDKLIQINLADGKTQVSFRVK